MAEHFKSYDHCREPLLDPQGGSAPAGGPNSIGPARRGQIVKQPRDWGGG